MRALLRSGTCKGCVYSLKGHTVELSKQSRRWKKSQSRNNSASSQKRRRMRWQRLSETWWTKKLTIEAWPSIQAKMSIRKRSWNWVPRILEGYWRRKHSSVKKLRHCGWRRATSAPEKTSSTDFRKRRRSRFVYKSLTNLWKSYADRLKQRMGKRTQQVVRSMEIDLWTQQRLK